MRVALTDARVLLDGTDFSDGLAVVVEGAEIVAVVAAADVPADAERRSLAGRRLVPGFIDTQVNGGGDRLFNDDPSVATIAAIGAAHRRFGTTGFLPTLISDDLSIVRAAVAAVEAAIAAGVPGVLGIHIEGPFLNVSRRGIHHADKIIELGEDGFAALTGPTNGRTLVTLAPERTTPAMIRRLAAAGVIVAAGHTNGSYAKVRAGLDAGITGFTHLFNAMSPLTSREPGAVGAALEDVMSWCGLIVDGHHVDPVTLRLALRCKPFNRFMLVTDAMPSVGSANKSFMLQGEAITATGGICVNAAGRLAGSDLDMAAAVRNAVAMLGVSLADAVRMASRHPAEFLRLGDRYGRIAAGYRANLVELGDDGAVVRTWIDGRPEG